MRRVCLNLFKPFLQLAKSLALRWGFSLRMTIIICSFAPLRNLMNFVENNSLLSQFTVFGKAIHAYFIMAYFDFYEILLMLIINY